MPEEPSAAPQDPPPPALPASSASPRIRPGHLWLGAAAAVILLAALAALALVVEHRTHLVATRLGEYLLAHNARRPRQGAIWQAIEGNRQERARVVPVAPSAVDVGSAPPVVLATAFTARRDGDDIWLRARALDRPVRPGQAGGEQMRWLAGNLRTYRAGEAILGAAVLREEPYRRRARRHLDSLMADGAVLAALDRELATRGGQGEWRFSRLPSADAGYWQARLEEWLQAARLTGADSLRPWEPVPDSLALAPTADADLRGPRRAAGGRYGAAVLDPARPGPDGDDALDTVSASDPAARARLVLDPYTRRLRPAAWPPSDSLPGQAMQQERAYQEACAALAQFWADSLYTRDYLRLVDAWTAGEDFTALARVWGPTVTGRARLEDGARLVFQVAAETVTRALTPGADSTATGGSGR